MSTASARAAAVYQQTHVQSRSPLELVVMLYDGALRFLAEAHDALERRDLVTKREALSRALAIISELQGSLNLEEGGDIASSLDAIYAHVTERVVDANMYQDPERIREVRQLLTPLRDAWAEIATPAPPQDAT